MSPTVERAAMSATAEDIRAKLARAPRWVRDLATAHAATQAPAARPAARVTPPQALAPVIGWAAGACAPGVSRSVAFCTRDRETVAEELSPECVRDVVRQTRRVDKPVPVTLDHGGEIIADTRSLDVVFSVDERFGLMFELRLRDTPVGRRILATSSTDGLGVSVGFGVKRSRIETRRGVGRVRVLEAITLDHVAIMPTTSPRRPVYPGARCFGARGAAATCPQSLYRQAEKHAEHEIERQKRGLYGGK